MATKHGNKVRTIVLLDAIELERVARKAAQRQTSVSTYIAQMLADDGAPTFDLGVAWGVDNAKLRIEANAWPEKEREDAVWAVAIREVGYTSAPDFAAGIKRAWTTLNEDKD